MYEIYINETKIVLLPSNKLSDSVPRDENNLVVRYTGKTAHLLNFIDMCEKTTKQESILIHSVDYEKLEEDFTSIFKTVEAAGGAVLNERNQILMIYRRGSWDLPKGKKEEGEKRRETAIREVMEETGVENLVIGDKLRKTYHTYRNRKGARCIKLTHWYMMSAPHQELVPQVEEGIEKCEWMTLDRFYARKRKVFGNILSVLNSVEKNNANNAT